MYEAPMSTWHERARVMVLIPQKPANGAAKRQAGDAVRPALRALAANMIGVVHGAGRPHCLRQAMAECMNAFEEYRVAHAFYPDSYTILKALDPERRWPEGTDEQDDYWDRPADNPSQEQIWALECRSLRRDMRRASLRLTASMLTGQMTERPIADRELGDAVRAHERITEVRRVTRESATTSRPLIRQREPTIRLISPAAKPEWQAPLRGHADSFEPPNYAGFRPVVLTDDLRAEFGAPTALELVHELNRFWRAEGKKPLAQGSFPSTTMKLTFVVKELRSAIVRNSDRLRSG